MKIRFHIFFIVSFILFSSCKNEIKKEATDAETIADTDSLVKVDTSAQKHPIWISEFQRLRQALGEQDMPAIATFFDFPLTNEQADGLLAAIYFNTNKDLSKAVELKSKSAFEKYSNQIFPAPFVNGLTQINIDSLTESKFATSANWKLPNDNALYHSSVTYDEFEKMVSLLLNAAYKPEEGSDDDSETESATVYIFRLDKNNKLKFERVEMAG